MKQQQEQNVEEVLMTRWYICENDLMQKWKREEMQLQKQRLEAESRKEEQFKKQHQKFAAGHATAK